MKRIKSTCAAAAVITAISTQGAWADVTARQVWDDWKAYMQGFGYDMTATESQSGDTLTVSDIAMAMELPEDSGQMTFGMTELAFTDNGDGTVAIRVPSNLPITFDVRPEGEDDVQATVEYANTGLAITVSGDPDDMTYAYSAAELSMALTQLTVEGEDASAFINAGFIMNGLLGSSNMKTGGMREFDQTYRADSLSYDINFRDPETGESGLFKGTYRDVTFDGTGAFPMEMNPENMAAMLAAGFRVDGSIEHKGSTAEFSVQDGEAPVAGNSSSTSGALKIKMNANAVAYDVDGTDLVFNIAGGEIPLPIQIQMGRMAMNIMMPVAPGETEQDFALGLTLGDFTIADMLWNIFDPANVLPRDPATIALDLSGKAKLFVDIMNPEAMAMAEMNGEMPGELNALTLNDLTISVAGANLTGTGDFTFDNTDLVSFDGMPRPLGAVDLELKGANGLMDKLIQMGLLPEEQAMGARMMMGLFAVPVGDDHLQSKIEVNEEGHVLANGQRLK